MVDDICTVIDGTSRGISISTEMPHKRVGAGGQVSLPALATSTIILAPLTNAMKLRFILSRNFKSVK